ncbi:MAG: ferritin-like domain-containing protein [Usitatibacteraceae bacterium]
MNKTAQKKTSGSAAPTLTSTATLRANARRNIEEGAVTVGYAANREQVLKMLNDALATEIVCMLRYKRHYFMATGVHAETVVAEFLEHATQEEEHADQIAARIVQLGGEPDFSPDTLTKRSHAEYVPGKTLIDMIKEDLIAERIAIDSYKEMIDVIGNDDTTTRRMLESILAVEEEHADDLAALLDAGR